MGGTGKIITELKKLMLRQKIEIKLNTDIKNVNIECILTSNPQEFVKIITFELIGIDGKYWSELELILKDFGLNKIESFWELNANVFFSIKLAISKLLVLFKVIFLFMTNELNLSYFPVLYKTIKNWFKDLLLIYFKSVNS